MELNKAKKKKFVSIRRIVHLLSLVIICLSCIEIKAQGCNCQEYLFVNEVFGGGAVHKYTINPNGQLDEIISIGPWYPNGGTSELPSPHGLGTDLNGFLYIGSTQYGNTGEIRKLDCDGNLFPETGPNGFTIADIGVHNMSSIDNTIIAKTFIDSPVYADNSLFAFDLCTGSLLGQFNFGVDLTWAFYIDQDDFMYTSSDSNNGTIFKFTLDDINGGNISPYISDVLNNADPSLSTLTGGITSDLAGNIYQVVSDGWTQPAQILKYDSNGNFINSSLVDNDPNDGGWYGAIGVAYSETCNCLYTTNANTTEDCVSVFDLDLNYTGVGVGPVDALNPSPDTPIDLAKAVGIIKECCPSPATQTIDQTFCANSINQRLFLNELFPCDGIVCGAEWTSDPNNTGVTYDPCDQSITINTGEACAIFTKQGSNNQCGAFDLTYNLDILVNMAPVISGTSPTCVNDNNPNALSIDTPASGSSLTYTWQSSTSDCDNGWTDIVGAPTDGTPYDPPVISQETYYRVITEAAGTCSSGMCADTSNCVTLTPESGCVDLTYSLGNRVFSDDDNNGLQDGTESGIDGVVLQLLNSDGSIYDSDPNNSGIQALQVTTGSGGYYRFDELPAGDYIVEVMANNFTSGSGILENLESSTGAGQETSPNVDGDMNDNGLDMLVMNAVRSGIITLGGTEPSGEVEPSTYATGSTTGTAAADTESNLTVDFGFYAPRREDYPDFEDPNNPCNDLPCHTVSNEIYFGSGVTNDNVGSGDNSASSDLDDGVFISPDFDAVSGNIIRFPVSIYNNTGNDAFVRAWIDWNGDGDFEDVDELVYDDTYPSTGTITDIISVTISNDAVLDEISAMRWRISTDDANSNSPCGTGTCAADGEIEDYLLQFSCPVPLCVPIESAITRN